MNLIEGYFDASSSAHIVVESDGHFHLVVTQADSGRPQGVNDVTGGYTCVLLSDFANAPSPTTAFSNLLDKTSISDVTQKGTTASARACEWQGLVGPLSAQTSESPLSAHHMWSNALATNTPSTEVEAHADTGLSISSRGFCTDYSPSTTWTIYTTSSVTAAPTVAPGTSMAWLGGGGIAPTTYWCYLEGVDRVSNSSLNQDIIASINTSFNSSTSEVDYYATTTGAGLWWNCLKLSH